MDAQCASGSNSVGYCANPSDVDPCVTGSAREIYAPIASILVIIGSSQMQTVRIIVLSIITKRRRRIRGLGVWRTNPCGHRCSHGNLTGARLRRFQQSTTYSPYRAIHYYVSHTDERSICCHNTRCFYNSSRSNCNHTNDCNSRCSTYFFTWSTPSYNSRSCGRRRGLDSYSRIDILHLLRKTFPRTTFWITRTANYFSIRRSTA